MIDTCLGMIDFYSRPSYRASWGGPFNGQRARQALFVEIVGKIAFDAIVETGTYRGTTTEYMHEVSRLPVYTVEAHPRYYGYAKARFAFTRGISVCRDDSRTFLRRIGDEGDRWRTLTMFFYLDAHWGKDQPLRDEIRLVFDKFANAVVMIDDFRVPHDPEYAYDRYSDGQALSLEYISPLASIKGASVFFPRFKAAQDTGMKRGCVVLARVPHLVERLETVHALSRGAAARG